MKSFLDLAKGRYSVRAFSDREVEREKIDYILEAAQAAPTAKNFQPQRIYLARSKDAIEKLGQTTRCLYGAKQVFVVCSDDSDWVSPFNGRRSGEMDASIVCTHMMLAAEDVGLGTCWVCWCDTDRIKQLLDLPENVTVQCLLPFGYPAENAAPAARHTERKPISEVVTEI